MKERVKATWVCILVRTLVVGAQQITFFSEPWCSLPETEARDWGTLGALWRPVTTQVASSDPHLWETGGGLRAGKN